MHAPVCTPGCNWSAVSSRELLLYISYVASRNFYCYLHLVWYLDGCWLTARRHWAFLLGRSSYPLLMLNNICCSLTLILVSFFPVPNKQMSPIQPISGRSIPRGDQLGCWSNSVAILISPSRFRYTGGWEHVARLCGPTAAKGAGCFRHMGPNVKRSTKRRVLPIRA